MSTARATLAIVDMLAMGLGLIELAYVTAARCRSRPTAVVVIFGRGV